MYGSPSTMLWNPPPAMAVTILPGGNRGLAKIVVTPSGHFTVAFQSQAVLAASGNCLHIRQSGRNIGLAVIIVTPCDHCSVTLQSEAVLPASGNGHDVRQPGRNIGLAPGVVTPGDHRAVSLQSQTMSAACPDVGATSGN